MIGVKVLLLVCLGARLIEASTITGNATPFVKCEGVQGATDDCIEAVLSEIDVAIGKPGTNDDVTIEVCSDIDKTQCCTTPALKSLLSNDWSENDREKWSDRYFGPCKDKKFTVKRGLELTLSKSKDSALNVTSIDVYTKSPDKKITDLERFQCGNFNIGGTKLTKETKQCKTGPYHYEGIEKMIVNMGADGTEDNVNVKICSDTNDLCCETVLKKTDGWKAGKKQEWLPAEFGDCKALKFKATANLQFSVIKDGKDDVSVSNVEFYFTQQDASPLVTSKYACEGFDFKGECKVASLCTYKFAKCVRTVAPTEIKKQAPPTPAPGAATPTTQKSWVSKLFGSGDSSTTTTASTTTTTKGTTRPPFRSTSG